MRLFTNRTWTYVFALGIIAGLSMLAYLSMIRVIDAQRQYAPVINLSGKQRMLSQRLCYLTLRMWEEPQPEARVQLSQQIDSLLSLMQTHHLILLQGSDSLEIAPLSIFAVKAAMVQGGRSLSQRLDHFWRQIRRVQRGADQQTPEARQTLEQLLASNDQAVLLEALDAVVFAYEQHAQEEIAAIHRQEQIILLITLLVLILEAVLIFRPMVRQIRQQQLTLRQNNADLRERAEDLEKTIYAIVHDFKGPLRAINGYAQLMQETMMPQPEEEVSSWLQHMRQSSLRMRDLTDDLVAYLQVGLQDQAHWVDLQALWHEVMTSSQVEYDQLSPHISSSHLPKLYGYPHDLRLMLQQLLRNALTFQPAGQQPQVHFTARPAQGGWAFDFQDNGIGMDPALGDTAFRLFTRLHSRDVFPGNGVGLAICKKVVSHHRGEIRLSSALGEGTTVHFSLKLPPPTPTDTAQT